MIIRNLKNSGIQETYILNKYALPINKQASKNINKFYIVLNSLDIKNYTSDEIYTHELSLIVTNEIIISQSKEKDVPSKTIHENLNVNLDILKNLILILTCIITTVSTIT